MKRRTACLNIAQSLKRTLKTSSFYSIFAFDVSQFKRKSRRILINFNHTYNNDLFIIKYPSVSYNFNNLIGIYIYISWNCEYVANDTIADESFPSSGYLRKNRNPLPSLQRRKFKRGILKKSISSTSTRWNVRGYSFFISWLFIFLFVVIFTVDHAGSAN